MEPHFVNSVIANVKENDSYVEVSPSPQIMYLNASDTTQFLTQKGSLNVRNMGELTANPS